MPSRQVMRLRDENEALMETLVRAKVELAETQGEKSILLPPSHDGCRCDHDLAAVHRTRAA